MARIEIVALGGEMIVLDGDKLIDVHGERYVTRGDVNRVFTFEIDSINVLYTNGGQYEGCYAVGLATGNPTQQEQLEDGAALSIGCIAFDESATRQIREWAGGRSPEVDFWTKALKTRLISPASLKKAARLKSPYQHAIREALAAKK